MKTVLGLSVRRWVTVIVLVLLVAVRVVGPCLGPTAPLLCARGEVRSQFVAYHCSSGISILAFFQACP